MTEINFDDTYDALAVVLSQEAEKKETIYKSRPIKRKRRTKAEIEVVKSAIYQLLDAENPMTVRQTFYRLVSNGVIEKTEKEYKSTVVRLLTQMRRRGEIPYGWIADNTRWMRKPHTFSSMESALVYTAQTYRRALWDTQDAYVEIWLEKDALAGVLYEVTEQWDVPLMVTRGYPSLSFLHNSAEAIREQNCPVYLYYFGDYDPSGIDIPRKVEGGIRELAPDAEVYFERVAVTEAQIIEWDLPTRPTKRTDSRSKNFEGESVEADAIPTQQLKALTELCIDRHINPYALDKLQTIEAEERASFQSLVEIWK